MATTEGGIRSWSHPLHSCGFNFQLVQASRNLRVSNDREDEANEVCPRCGAHSQRAERARPVPALPALVVYTQYDFVEV